MSPIKAQAFIWATTLFKKASYSTT